MLCYVCLGSLSRQKQSFFHFAIGDKRKMVEFIVKGGVFMYPIIFCSVVALAIFFERLWFLRRKNIIPEDFVQKVEGLLRKGKIGDATFLCQSDVSSIAKIFLAGLKNTRKGLWLVKEAIEERGSREATILERNVNLLATLANVATLLGLLGTVSGMIKTFNAISIQGIGNPAPLAGGIAEALLTTAAGLCVAIPTLVCHRFLRDRAGKLIFEMEENSIKLVQIMEEQNQELTLS